MLRALSPSSNGAKSPLRGRIGFGALAGKDAFEFLRGLIPVQPDGESRAWGVNSFAVLPMSGGVFREDVAQECGYRVLASSR